MYCLLMREISYAEFVIFTVYRATERKTSASRTNIRGDRTVHCLNSAESILSPLIWTLEVQAGVFSPNLTEIFPEVMKGLPWWPGSRRDSENLILPQA